MYQQSGDLQQELEDLLRLNAPYEFEPNIGSIVLDRIDSFYRRYVVYPSDGARWAHVLWTAHCWLMDCWYRTPRLLFISPRARQWQDGGNEAHRVPGAACRLRGRPEPSGAVPQH